MIEMHSKYDNMHVNGIFYALICINNHIFAWSRLHVIRYRHINKDFHENFIFLKSINRGRTTIIVVPVQA